MDEMMMLSGEDDSINNHRNEAVMSKDSRGRGQDIGT